MVVTRAIKTLDVAVIGDTWVLQSQPDRTGGTDATMGVAGGPGGPVTSHVLVQLPNAPSDADTGQSYEGITKVELVLKQNQTDRVVSTTLWALESLRDFAEDSLTFKTRPTASSLLGTLTLTVPNDVKTIDISAIITTIGLLWSDRCAIELRDIAGASVGTSYFLTKESSDVANRPYIRVTYQARPPDAVADLHAEAASDDPILSTSGYIRLRWTSVADQRAVFSKYEIYRKDGAGAWTKRVEITQLGAKDWVDDGLDQGFGAMALVENVVSQYDIRVTDTNGSSISSNIVWLIRPDITSVTDVAALGMAGTKGTVRITPAAYVATPSPVKNVEYFVSWGDAGELDTTTSRFKTDVSPADKDHIYPYTGLQSRRARVKNDLGFWSNLTAGSGSTVVADNPQAKITAGPTTVLAGGTVYFSGEESYPRAANLTLNQYEWDFDWDTVPGNFVPDVTSSSPTTSHVYGAPGSYNAGLRVRDTASTLSFIVFITITVVANTVVNLDALVDGWKAIIANVGRGGADMEGPIAAKMSSTGKRLIRCRLEGTAFSNPDVNGIPADALTLYDVRDNNKRVQTAKITGIAKTGVLRNVDVKSSTPGIYEWTATLVLEA